MLQTQPDEKQERFAALRPIPFAAPSESRPHNASEIVALADSRFLFCDNNVGDALFELRLNADGSMACPLVKRPLVGVEPGTVDDLEGMTHVRAKSGHYLVAVPSLSLKRRKTDHRKRSKRGKDAPARNGLLRIKFGENDRLETDTIPEFRAWLLDNAPELGKAGKYLPDDGGLNVEGLGWSAADEMLLLGLRTPVRKGRPLLLRIRLKQVDGPWDLSNFEMLPSVSLNVEDVGDEQGIRTIGYDASRDQWLIVVGNATSDSKAPFALYFWDGDLDGDVRCVANVRFHKRMKVEGVTHGTIGGRGAIVFVDDAGGYQVLWDDDPRLQ